LAERFFSKTKHYQPIATSCDKLAANYLTRVEIAIDEAAAAPSPQPSKFPYSA
jgi:transposase